MGEITNPFYPEVLDLLLAALEGQGYRALIKRLERGPTADVAIEEVLRYRVRGVIVTSSVISDAMAQKCGRSSVPVVLFNRHMKDLGVSSVCCDNAGAGQLVANLLLDTGHIRPAFVSGSDEATTNRDRKKGFLNCIARRGISRTPVDGGGENSHAVGYAATRRLLTLTPRPDALFCASDILAFGALDAIREMGLRVPDDISVVGFDDVPMSSWPVFNLTTVRQQRQRMVQEAVNDLLAHIENETGPTVRLVPGELILRSTVRGKRRDGSRSVA